MSTLWGRVHRMLTLKGAPTLAKVGSSISKFNRMIEECEKGNLDIILTKSVSCFGRDTIVRKSSNKT
ncbi:hypothetical protein HMPREF0520_0640 [Lactobacillus iners DSM 13335]|uniref:Resolvase/invertase-type recombinase catalytic domain-containing protein n=1 Tax=Lactobacillus iners DSM 13335 TaxID=525328 RepID=C8PC20_9LACO|nr:hypothetical protein HMPREF0520_0640 [Lactobacillus iners DSM 13335]